MNDEKLWRRSVRGFNPRVVLGVTIPHSLVAPLPLRVVTHCDIRTGLHLLPILILLLLLLLLSNR